jgi:hypothetical protein
MARDNVVLQEPSSTDVQGQNGVQPKELDRNSKAATGAVLRRQQQEQQQQNGLHAGANGAGQPTASDPSLEAQPGEVWYLAFGSNMNTKASGDGLRVRSPQHIWQYSATLLGTGYASLPKTVVDPCRGWQGALAKNKMHSLLFKCVGLDRPPQGRPFVFIPLLC